MRIGVISDTHGTLPALAKKALEGCDHIIHAGDICSSSVLYGLEEIAPVTAVLGNCDYNDFGPSVGFSATPTIDGVRFIITHRPEDLGFVDPTRFDVAVYGHTHHEVVMRKHGVLMVNPGSPTRPRGKVGPSVAIIETDNGQVKSATIVPLLEMAEKA